MKRIAMLGPGTFSEESAQFYFRNTPHEFVPYKLISDVFMSTASGETDLCLVPIENTIDGSVSLHLDWLVHEVELPIQAEWVYPIVMNLIGRASDLDMDSDGAGRYARIHKVLSYPVAIAQCRQFLQTYMPGVELEPVGNTAEGARMIKNHPEEGIAAISNASAAEIYGIDLLEESIQDHTNNYTRFILAGHQSIRLPHEGTAKTTVIIVLPEDYPGALHQVLSAFAWRRINLSKIESRPTKKKLGSYYFYIDLEGSASSILLSSAIAEIEAIGCQVRLLGSYQSYTYETNSEV